MPCLEPPGSCSRRPPVPIVRIGHRTGAQVAVLLDTSEIPSSQRREAFRAAMTEVSGATHVVLDDAPGGVIGRMALYDLGSCRIFTAESTGITMSRDRRT